MLFDTNSVSLCEVVFKNVQVILFSAIWEGFLVSWEFFK